MTTHTATTRLTVSDGAPYAGWEAWPQWTDLPLDAGQTIEQATDDARRQARVSGEYDRGDVLEIQAVHADGSSTCEVVEIFDAVAS